VGEGSVADVDAAVKAARASAAWLAKLSGHQRAKYLMRWRGRCKTFAASGGAGNAGQRQAYRESRDIDIPLSRGHFIITRWAQRSIRIAGYSAAAWLDK